MNTQTAVPRISARTRRQQGTKIIRGLLIGLAVVLVAAWLVVGGVAADSLTVPERHFDPNNHPGRYGMAYEDVSFTSRDGSTQLAGWYIPAEASEKAVVFVHGRKASRTAAYGSDFDENGVQTVPGKLLEFIAALNKAGYSVFVFDLRGHGQSGEGRFSYGVKERLDALAAVDWLKAKGYQPGKIAMMGNSLGAAASIGAAAADVEIGALVTDSVFANFGQIAEMHWVEESGLPMIFLSSTRLMIRLMYGWNLDDVLTVEEISLVAPRPVMMIHCQDDKLIPISQFDQLRLAAPAAETWVLPHCIHGQTYNTDPENFEEKVIGFLDRSLD